MFPYLGIINNATMSIGITTPMLMVALFIIPRYGRYGNKIKNNHSYAHGSIVYTTKIRKQLNVHQQMNE